MFKTKFKKAYSIMEAMIAIAVLSSVTIVALNTITNAADTENLNKDYMTALMLIDSGAQEVMGLYKNNLEKFGKENEANCGLNINLSVVSSSNCAAANNIYNGDYIIFIDPSNQVIKSQIVTGGTFSEDEVTTEYRVYEASIGSDDFLLTQNSALGVTNPTKYYRRIVATSTVNGSNLDVELKIEVAFQKRGGKYSIQSKTINLTLGE
jgi:type II secretory pathway pseudopilin PulG